MFDQIKTLLQQKRRFGADLGFAVQAGAGIVYDSDPEKEWDETMNKGRALFRAVAEAAKGL